MGSIHLSSRQLPIDLVTHGFSPIDRAWVMDKIFSLENLAFDTRANNSEDAIEDLFDRIREVQVELEAFGYTMPPWLINGKAISILHPTFPQFVQDHFAAQPDFLNPDAMKCKSLEHLKQYYLSLNHDDPPERSQKGSKRRLKRLRRKAAVANRRLNERKETADKHRQKLLSNCSRELRKPTGPEFGAEVWSMLADEGSISQQARAGITRLLLDLTDGGGNFCPTSDADSTLSHTWETADGCNRSMNISPEASSGIGNDDLSDREFKSSQNPSSLPSPILPVKDLNQFPARQSYAFSSIFGSMDTDKSFDNERSSPLTYRSRSIASDNWSTV